MKKYLIVNGWIHPKGYGDDRKFRRGFAIPASVSIDKFEEWLRKDLSKRSAVTDDYAIEEVTKKKWEEEFDLQPTN